MLYADEVKLYLAIQLYNKIVLLLQLENSDALMNEVVVH